MMALRDRKRPTPDAAFDLWLKASLREQFGTVAAEPIPMALLALLDRIGDAPSPDGTSGDGDRMATGTTREAR